MSDVDEHVATNVRVYRESRGLSQEDLAQQMTDRGFGFSQATIWKVEQGKRPVRFSEAIALAEALGLRSWGELALEPEASRRHARLQRAGHAAHDAYQQIKTAAAAYLEAQLAIVLEVRDAHDAGVAVNEMMTAWLTTPAERAVLEARIEWEQADDVAMQVDNTVDDILQALRDRGVEAIFRIEDAKIIPADQPPAWTPPQPQPS